MVYLRARMAETFEQLRLIHVLLSDGIHPHHEVLYKAYPTALGYSSQAMDDVLFDGALVLALHQAGKEGRSNLRKVYFFVPGAHEKWVVDRFRNAAQRIFGRLKAGKSVPAIRHFAELFRYVMMGSQISALPQEPERWVAFGFARSDVLPEWLRSKLVEVL
jgi:hypothetical protein